MSDRDQFFDTIRRSLGVDRTSIPRTIPDATSLSRDSATVKSDARSIVSDAEIRHDELFTILERTAGEAGWHVFRASNSDQISSYIVSLVKKLEADTVLRSDHDVFSHVDIEPELSSIGTKLITMTINSSDDPDVRRSYLRQIATDAEIAVTGVDYGIAETGSCVLLASEHVSRLVALLPPVHVAIVMKSQVIERLEDLFTLRREAFLDGKLGSYMNIISGPSRSADIEQTIVTGVHGPGEVHMVLFG